MNKPQWDRLQEIDYQGIYFTTQIGETRYWIRSETTWHVEDDCGAVWVDYKTAEEAMQAVEKPLDNLKRGCCKHGRPLVSIYPCPDCKYEQAMKPPPQEDYATPKAASADCRRACEAITACLKRRKAMHSGGQRVFYTADEWIARNEEFGQDAVLIVVHDGGERARFFNLVDYGQNKSCDEMWEALKAAGFWAGPCTSCYTAVYKLK